MLSTLSFCHRLMRGEDPTVAAQAAGLSGSRADDHLEALQAVGYWLGDSLREEEERVGKALASERAKLAELRTTEAEWLFVSSEDVAQAGEGVTVTVVAPFGAECVSRQNEIRVDAGPSGLRLEVRHNGEVLEPPAAS